MPVTICSTKRIRVALPKTYHQLAVVRGTGWASIGSRVARAPRRWSNQWAMAEMRRMVVLVFTRVQRASESVHLGPRAGHRGSGSHTRTSHVAVVQRPVNRPHSTPRRDRGT